MEIDSYDRPRTVIADLVGWHGLGNPISVHPDQRIGEVNKLFERWNTSSTPGMKIAVFHDASRSARTAMEGS